MALFNLNRFYNQIAPLYSRMTDAIPIWRRFIEEAMAYLPHEGVILEIGSGPGYLLASLASCGVNAVGIDRSSGMQRQAQKRLQCLKFQQVLCRGDALSLPMPDDSFDAVVSTFSLSAIPEGAAAIQEMCRVLKAQSSASDTKKGTLVIVDAGYPDNRNIFGSSLARLWELGGDHLRDEREMMTQAGLHIIHREELGASGSVRITVGQKNV